MDYNVVTNLAGNLGSFSTAFKSYVRKCDSASKRLDKVEEEFDRYKAMSFKEYYLDKHIAKFMDEHATELAAKSEAQREAWINLERTHAEENLRALSEDELEDVKTEYIALTSDSASLKRLGKVATERENILREKENLKKAIRTVRENNQDYREIIEGEVATIERRDMAALRRQIKDAKNDTVLVDKLNKQIAELEEKVAFYRSVLGLLDTFEAELDDVVERNEEVGELFNVNFEESNEVFRTIANGLARINEENVKSGEKVDEVVDETKKIAVKVEKRKGRDFVFDLVANADNTFSIVMRKAGFKHAIHDLEATELTEDFINKNISDFAKTVASETKFTKQEILDGQVVIRFNGLVIGLNDKAKDGKYNMAELPSIIAAGLDNLSLPEPEEVVEEEVIEEVTPEEPVVVAAVEETPVEEEVVEETSAEEVVVEEAPAEEVVVEEAPAEEVIVEEAPAEEVVVEEAPAEEVVVEETPAEEVVVEETPAEEVVVEETPAEEVVVEETPAEEVVVEETPVEETPAVEEVEEEDLTEGVEVSEEELTTSEPEVVVTKADKMAKVIASKKTKFGRTRDMAVLAAAGLFGFSLLGASTLPLAVFAAGVATASSVRGLMTDMKQFVGRKSAYRQLNKLARKFDAEVEYDFDAKRARFVVKDPDTDVIRFIDAHDLGAIEADYGVDVQAELDRIFKNKRRGLSSPKTIEEINFKDFKKVTVSNLEAAYDEFGGMMTPEAEQSFAYRAFSGKKGEKVEKEGPGFGEKISGFFADHNPFKRKDDEDEVELEDEEPAVEETPAEEVVEDVTPVDVDEDELFVVPEGEFDDLDEAEVISLEEIGDPEEARRMGL